MSDQTLEQREKLAPSPLAKSIEYGRVDHLAIAVIDLDKAVDFYTSLFGFTLQKRREINGKFSGMRSAELEGGEFSIVLVQGTSEESQINQYIERYGPGVQHVAISVDNLDETVAVLRENQVQFATEIIAGNGLRQIFTKRDANTGMMMEIIERSGQINGFQKQNIQSLFDQLERHQAY